jgi:hypothetical protein
MFIKAVYLASLEEAVVVCVVSAAVQPCILLSAPSSQQLPSMEKPHEALYQQSQNTVWNTKINQLSAAYARAASAQQDNK